MNPMLFLQSKGYPDQIIQKILSKESIKLMPEETLVQIMKNDIKYFESLNYSIKEIIDLTKKHPQIFSYSDSRLKQTFNYFDQKGYSFEDTKKLTKRLPAIFGRNENYLDDRFDYFIQKKYTKEDVVVMTKKLAQLFSYSEKRLDDRFDYLLKKGYCMEDIISMTKRFPQLFSYSEQRIEDRYRYLIRKGYDKDQIIKMTVELPTIYGSKEESLDNKIDFMKTINLEPIILESAKYLIQSVELTYARYAFFQDRKEKINRQNYNRLFRGAKKFEQSYCITSDELLTKYQFSDYIKRKGASK